MKTTNALYNLVCFMISAESTKGIFLEKNPKSILPGSGSSAMPISLRSSLIKMQFVNSIVVGQRNNDDRAFVASAAKSTNESIARVI